MGNTTSQSLLDQIEVQQREIQVLRKQINNLIEKEKKKEEEEEKQKKKELEFKKRKELQL